MDILSPCPVTRALLPRLVDIDRQTDSQHLRNLSPEMVSTFIRRHTPSDITVRGVHFSTALSFVIFRETQQNTFWQSLFTRVIGDLPSIKYLIALELENKL